MDVSLQRTEASAHGGHMAILIEGVVVGHIAEIRQVGIAPGWVLTLSGWAIGEVTGRDGMATPREWQALVRENAAEILALAEKGRT